MGIWDMIMIVAVLAIASEFAKFFIKTRAKSKTVGKDELIKLRNVISTMQTDLDEIKTDLRTVVIQMDDFNLYKAGSPVGDKKG